MDIRFADHPSFQRAAAGMVSGALLFGAALHPVTGMAPIAGGILGIAAGAAIAHGMPGWRMSVAALAVIFVLAPSTPLLLVVAALVSLALVPGGRRGLRGLIGMLASAIVVLIAAWCALRIGHARQTAGWPPWMTTLVAAAAMGVVGALAMVPRHLVLVLDPVGAVLKRLPAGLDAEVRDLCTRATAIWRAAQAQRSDEVNVSLVRDGAIKTLEVAARTASVKITGPSDGELARRMADLDDRIAAASDAEIIAQYQAARGALGDQQRYRDRIRQGRERLVARMHNHVAALEKFAFALEAAGAGASAVAQLDALSLDVAASGDALAALELGDAPARAAVPAT